MDSSITLKNNIPILSYKSFGLLSKTERKLSKFFKCCSKQSIDGSSANKCFWSGDNVEKFRQHLQSHGSDTKLFCNYCKTDANSESEDIELYSTQDCDQLITHLIQTHGERGFQCNRCHYRAITSTHIQLHQISAHYLIWSNNNSLISYDSLDDPNKDFCKIIVCKAITFGPTVDYSVWIQKFTPTLDSDLAEKTYLCLFCNYSNEEVMEVFLHCVRRHRDSAICVYHKECHQNYVFEQFEDISNSISSNESDLEVMEVSNTADNDPPLTDKGFRTQCTVDCNPAIPGLEDEFMPKIINEIMPRGREQEFGFRGRHESRFRRGQAFRPRSHRELWPRRQNEVEFRTREEFRPLEEQLKSRRVEKEWHRNSFEDDFAGYEPDNEDCREPTAPISQPMVVPPPHTLIQTVPQMPINSSIGNTHKEPNPGPKSGGYREYKRQQQLKRQLKQSNQTNSHAKRGRTVATTSAPSGLSREMPPEIDLQSIETELNITNESGIRNNSFKQINRVGVSTDKGFKKANSSAITYLSRPEEETDEYIKLLNETSVPRKGVRARFENHQHFELTALQSTSSTFGDKNCWKCVLCSDDKKLRENNIKLHLTKVHNTDSSLKCGYCDFIGQRPMIVEHSKLKHPMAESKIEKYIVHYSQSSSIGFTSGTHLEKPKTTARKSTTAGAAHVAKGTKGALTQKIKESIFLGPLKNDRTSRGKNDRTEVLNPTKRVYNRTTHSSNIRSKKPPIIETDSEDEPEVQMESEIESESEVQMQTESEIEIESEVNLEVEPMRAKSISVAKKSTAKPSSESMLNESQHIICLPNDDIPSKFFCVFCTQGFIINNRIEAIEHYKTHLKLGYTCNVCRFWCVSFDSMTYHWNNVHKSEELDISDNMSDVITNWIMKFLDNQLKNADFAAKDFGPNSTGIDITCPLCVKAATICSMRARPFDSLWKVKLHICKHLQWMPMKCILCEGSDIMYPNNPYLLMKHLVDFHFNSCENLYNMSFRGQKPFNDMKREQLALIARNYTSVAVVSSDIINAFFYQLISELDWIYENQLKIKFGLNREIQIGLNRLVRVKAEPMDPMDQQTGDIESEEPQQSDSKDVKEDKKDIKSLVKLEIKNEIKSEVKTELKTELKDEVKDELKNEPKDELKVEDNDDIESSCHRLMNGLYGDSDEQYVNSNRVSSKSVPKPNPNSDDIDVISLSSDDDS